MEKNIKIVNLTDKNIENKSLKSYLLKPEEINNKIDMLLVIGDLVKHKKIYNQVKKENIFTFILSSQHKKSKNKIPSIFVEEDKIEDVLGAIIESINTKTIALNIEDLKLVLQSNCMAFYEEGMNVDDVTKKIQMQLKKQKIKDVVLVIYGDKKLGLFEIEDIVSNIHAYNKKAAILFAVSNTLEKSFLKVGVIAKLVE